MLVGGRCAEWRRNILVTKGERSRTLYPLSENSSKAWSKKLKDGSLFVFFLWHCGTRKHENAIFPTFPLEDAQNRLGSQNLGRTALECWCGGRLGNEDLPGTVPNGNEIYKVIWTNAYFMVHLFVMFVPFMWFYLCCCLPMEWTFGIDFVKGQAFFQPRYVILTCWKHQLSIPILRGLSPQPVPLSPEPIRVASGGDAITWCVGLRSFLRRTST